MTNVVVEQFQTPDTRRGARVLKLARDRAVAQLAGRRTWVIESGSSGPTRPTQPLVNEVEDDDAPTMQLIPSQTAESLATLIAVHVRTGDVVLIRDSAAIGVCALVRERGAHVIWDRCVPTRGPSFVTDLPPGRGQAPALDAWLTAWTSVSGRTPRRLAAFIGAPGIFSEKEIGAGAPGDSYEHLGWTSLLADVVREDRAERVGGTVAARPFVAPR